MMQAGRERDDELGVEGGGAVRRGLFAGVRRRPVVVMGIFCLLASVIFLAAPRMKRSYRVSGSFTVRAPEFGALPELGQLAATTVKNGPVKVHGGDVEVELGDLRADKSRVVTLSSASERRELAAARVEAAAAEIGDSLEKRAEGIVENYRAGLGKSAGDLDKQVMELSGKADAFGLAHRGVLPGDPESITGQFDALTTTLNGKQQDLLMLTQEIGQLEDYKKTNAANGGRGAPPPPGAPLPGAGGISAAAPAADPEVLALTAQLELLNHQINEQLTVMGRTEQHPYVVDLRKQQAAMRAKLEAAKQRAASGKPAPMDPELPQATGNTADANLVAAEQKLEQLQGQRGVLEAEVHQLMQQHDALRQKVEGILPQRQAYEKLTSALASARSDAAAVRARQEELDRQLPKHGAGAVEAEDNSGRMVEVSRVAMNGSSTLPNFPQLPVVYVAGLLIAGAVAAGAAWMIRSRDRTVHSAREFAALVDVPVLGTVSEIRTAQEERARRAWRVGGRPLVLAVLLGMMVTSAALCYRELADPGYGRGGVSADQASLFSSHYLGER